jgi:hypothetical protein
MKDSTELYISVGNTLNKPQKCSIHGGLYENTQSFLVDSRSRVSLQGRDTRLGITDLADRFG